jgi:integrase
MFGFFHCPPNIAAWRDAYLDFCGTRNVRRTRLSKEFAFRLLLERVGNVAVAALTKDRVLAFLDHVARERSGGSANDVRKRLSAAWEWGAAYMAHGFKDENPFRRVPRFPADEHPRYVPPYEDFAVVLALTTGADHALLLTALHTAARRGELFRLAWDDVDFDRGIIRLGTRKRSGGGMEYDWLPMTGELSRVLLAHKENPDTDKTLLFVRRDGRRYMTRPGFIYRLCDRAGVKRFGYHGIRHLSASMMAQHGMSIPGIQTVLRHKTPMTTALYLHRLGALKQDLDSVFEGQADRRP